MKRLNLLMFYLLQWNARSLIANGQEFKRYVDIFKGEYKPAVLCIQETWLKPCLDFVVPGYECIRQDRSGKAGGGCATFIRSDVKYQRVQINSSLECVVVKVWENNKWVNIVNFYNPCLPVSIIDLEEIMEQIGVPVIWLGDFNAHNPLWGSRVKDTNGSTVEDFMDKYGLVCMNDGRPTRFEIKTGAVSCIDLALASSEYARVGEWDNMDRYSMGSDHFPILLKFGKTLLTEDQTGTTFFNYGKADWEKFSSKCDSGLDSVNGEGTIDEWNNSLCSMILSSAYECIPLKRNSKTRVSVPWWNRACDKAVRDRNCAYRLLRRCPTENNAIEYKRLRAKARRVIKVTKKECWRRYCGTLGVDTSVGEIWAAVHRMSGVRRKRKMPVLEEKGVIAKSDIEKAQMCESKFKDVHRGVNIGEEGIRKRNETLRKKRI